MSRFRFRDEESSKGTTIATVLIGAVAGFAVGMYVAQRVGGFSGLAARLKKRGAGDLLGRHFQAADYDEIEGEEEVADASEDGVEHTASDAEDDLDDADGDGVPMLEERVLEAFNNDPILAERAIDIGSEGAGVIELAGWVESDTEAEHAMTLARGVPGVETIVNRLLVDDEEKQIGENLRRFESGDPALADARWEGQQVSIGKRRQGTSADTDRHADPKPVLEEHWLSEREAIRNAADDLEDIKAERRTKKGKGAKATNADEAEPLA